MSEKTDLDPRYLDKRTVQRYVKMGLVDEKSLGSHLKNLPDVAEKATRVETVSEDDPIDDEE